MLKLTILIAMVLFTVVVTNPSENMYSKIMDKFMDKPVKEIFRVFHYLNKKNYDLSSEEGRRRLKIFENNIETIKKHNSNHLRSYNLGVTEYADWSEDEWNLRYPKRSRVNVHYEKTIPIRKTTYAPLDWREKGINGPVKHDNGYTCRNTHVIAHSYVLEAWNYLNTGYYTVISPQNIIDCTSWDCSTYESPKWDLDYDFLYQNGMYSESHYPLTGTKGECNKDIIYFSSKYAPKKWEYPVFGNYDTETVYSVLKRGPFFFCLADRAPFLYTGGIYSDYSSSILCGFNNCFNDGAMLIGYGIDAATNTEYWIAKTTFGTSWGESGYMRFKRIDENQNFGLNCLYLKPGLDSLGDD